MSMKYYLAGSPLTFQSPQESFIYNFNYNLNDQFYNTFNAYTIYEETYLSSGSYQKVDVRVNTAIDSVTGQKLGDDFKILLFKPDHDDIGIGEKFWFNDNYWISVFTDNIKTSLGISCTIRRCNNMLRWRTEDGVIYSEHCIIDYAMATPRNRVRSDPLIPDGTIKVFTQLNSNTATIKENQRFMFGRENQWVCYQVYGGGLANYLNQKTTDNTSAYLLELAMGKNYVNEDTDDIINGIADKYKYTSASALLDSIQITPTSGSIIEGTTITYSCYLYISGVQQADTFTFSVSGSSSVPTSYYTFISIDGNSFSVENITKYLDSPLLIDCVSGAYSRQFSIVLRGAW